MTPGAAIFGLGGLVLTPDEREFFASADPWGFILFARNVDTPEQMRALCADLRDCVGREVPIFIDQEGGRVARMRAPHWREWPPALEDAVGPNAARRLWLRYRIISHELRAVGVDGNCAPLADIATEATHPILTNRCYGHDAARVADNARAVADALLRGGVLPVLKHIPGHGRVSADSHLELPATDATIDDLNASDFKAFAQLSDLPLGMTAHVVYSALDATAPATQSPVVLDHIRSQIGFDGLLMTDDLSMQALDGDMTSRARRSLDAGCDLVLHCNGDMAEMGAVADAAGRLGPQAARRADAALTRRKSPEPVDIDALITEYATRTA